MTTEAIPKSDNQVSNRLNELGQSLKKFWPRIKDFFVYAVAQVRISSKVYPGIMHLLIFWGVTIQVIGTAINLMQMQLFIPFVELPFPRNNAYLAYELIMDMAGVAILLGISMAAFRRLVWRPKTLESQWDDYYALFLLALIPIVGFSVEGLRLLSANPAWSAYSPVGSAVAGLFRTMGITVEQAMRIHPLLFWTHAALGLTLLASIPFTKLRHLVTTPLNVILHPQRKIGELEMIQDIEETELLGVGQVNEFTSQQLLSFDACVRCGRCEEVCPASISGMSYSPKDLIQTMREAMVSSLVATNGNSNHPELTENLPEATLWSCTTCGACLSVCPAFVNPVDEVIDLRRYQALTTGDVPKSVADTLRNMERQGNPWGMPAEDRIAWAEALDVHEIMPGEETDVLLFMGCASAYDDRNKKVAQSFIHLLQKANVDFAILGLDEICCGETARRLGHEYLFQVYAEQNIEAFNQVKFNRIVTQCPHCFNTLQNEYPQFGGNFQVQHFTEFLSELSLPLETTTTNGNGISGLVSYHDSCYLGRYNEIYEQPRALLNQAEVELEELPRNKANSFCCGGGGGQMWLETDADTRINQRRLDEALETDVNVVATACPYCLIMFDDAIRSKGIGDQIQVLDIAEILYKQIGD
jgi:Fe-S oxidoreductase/nitrate reductase gamma subunit